MAKKYKFKGAKFTDPEIIITGFSHSYDTGITTVDCHLSDPNDSASMTLSDSLVPNNFNPAGIKKWVDDVLDSKFIDNE